MEPAVVFIVLLVLGVPLVLAIWLIVRAVGARSDIQALTHRAERLELNLLALERRLEKSAAGHPAETTPPPSALPPEPALPPPPRFVPGPAPAPPRPVMPVPRPPPQPTPAATPMVPKPVVVPPRLPTPEPEFVAASREPKTPINWEQFMGVKLFAWVGGLALFLGVVFFVKYAFDRDLIPAQLRVAIGFLMGLGLLTGGAVMSKKNYAVLAQTLCATGVVILYAVTFACRSIYHFQFFGVIPTFLVMVLITSTAFLMAVRFEALVIAILGMLGGFLTPVLVHSNVDNPVGLFSYIAILDAGLLLVALHRRWDFLSALSALGTALLQIGWAARFFENGKYFEGNRILIPLAILLGFGVLYLGGVAWAKRRGQVNAWNSGSVLGLVAVALGFQVWFLSFATLAQRPWLMFSFVFLIDACVALLVLMDEAMIPAQPICGLGVFGLLGLWTENSLNDALLNAGLAFYFIFAVVHAVFPVLLQRMRNLRAPVWAGQFFPPLALVLVLIPIFKLAQVSFVVWPFVLLVDALAVGLALLTASAVCVVVVLLLTLAATGTLVFRIPVSPEGLAELGLPLVLIGIFAVLFVAVGIWMLRKFRPQAFQGGVRWDEDLFLPDNLASQLPILSAVLPFLLLIMATVRLPLANPSLVFGLALLLVVLLLGVARLLKLDSLPLVGLVCVAGLEATWQLNRFDPAHANTALVWYLVFFGTFAVFPFVFLAQFRERSVVWATAALAGVPHFILVHRLVAAVYPNHMMGVLPAMFALPPLISLILVLRRIPQEVGARMTQLAWFGGVALLFITLIFPIQFDRQWITIGWACEGAALLWLFHRIPHPGLRIAGVALLVTAFVRLAANPAVLSYHPRSATHILNWYLYSYGIVTVCLFAGARLLAPPRNQVMQFNVPPLLAGFGTVLAFFLLNIEIADYFSNDGSTLTFEFSGNFARDMTYSIAWALFALVLLVVGILKKIRASRYAALGLLSVTLIKLFFHDLARLDQLYRIGAFIGVAIIAMLASFAYQRFFAAATKTVPNSDVQPPAQDATQR